MTSRDRLDETPDLVSRLLTQMIERLDAGAQRMGSIETSIEGCRFELARLKEQVTYANGRTSKIEATLSQVIHDELPAVRAAVTTRIEEVEGNVEALDQQRKLDAARRDERRKVRDEDRARLRYFWDVIDHPITKFAIGAIFLGLTILVGQVIPWLG